MQHSKVTVSGKTFGKKKGLGFISQFFVNGKLLLVKKSECCHFLLSKTCDIIHFNFEELNVSTFKINIETKNEQKPSKNVPAVGCNHQRRETNATTTYNGVEVSVVIDGWNYVIRCIENPNDDHDYSFHNNSEDEEKRAKKKHRKSKKSKRASQSLSKNQKGGLLQTGNDNNDTNPISNDEKIDQHDTQTLALQSVKTDNNIQDPLLKPKKQHSHVWRNDEVYMKIYRFLRRIVLTHQREQVDPADLLETRRHILSILHTNLSGLWKKNVAAAWIKLTGFVMMGLVIGGKKAVAVPPPSNDAIDLVRQSWEAVQTNINSAAMFFFEHLFKDNLVE
ncbi:hypothetical protein RFI_12682 [Reticulomyxa filosa]|uniref:Uncharacterized protein n=1 Tax=Reticulomyxa filosa TaxID=46433 RepID=X6N6P5_RETFI|nr:hypothetical protein RFI_15591 [Reticulomyxa filosa]ETO24476.1 hypothetical protein RFI_12682 [Reticulomyxa filosa]|eukprot:ETO21613.1 hypothetical protein RFI_15591 [Reticulomyxa filosa]